MWSVRPPFPLLSASLFPFALSHRSHFTDICIPASGNPFGAFFFPPSQSALGCALWRCLLRVVSAAGRLDTRTAGLAGHRILDGPFCNSSLLARMLLIYVQAMPNLGKVSMILEYGQPTSTNQERIRHYLISPQFASNARLHDQFMPTLKIW